MSHEFETSISTGAQWKPVVLTCHAGTLGRIFGILERVLGRGDALCMGVAGDYAGSGPSG